MWRRAKLTHLGPRMRQRGPCGADRCRGHRRCHHQGRRGRDHPVPVGQPRRQRLQRAQPARHEPRRPPSRGLRLTKFTSASARTWHGQSFRSLYRLCSPGSETARRRGLPSRTGYFVRDDYAGWHLFAKQVARVQQCVACQSWFVNFRETELVGCVRCARAPDRR
jgi:hypothetical protein